MHRHYSYRHFRSQVAPTNGAKSLYPQCTVIALAGDGCFMMSSHELATAMQYGLAVIFIIVNNAQFGTIRMHQERHYSNRVHGTGLTNPDFAAYAKAFGAYGERVEKTDQFMPAFERARQSSLPAVIEIRIPQDQSTPGATLEQIRQQGRR